MLPSYNSVLQLVFSTHLTEYLGTLPLLINKNFLTVSFPVDMISRGVCLSQTLCHHSYQRQAVGLWSSLSWL